MQRAATPGAAARVIGATATETDMSPTPSTSDTHGGVQMGSMGSPVTQAGSPFTLTSMTSAGTSPHGTLPVRAPGGNPLSVRKTTQTAQTTHTAQEAAHVAAGNVPTQHITTQTSPSPAPAPARGKGQGRAKGVRGLTRAQTKALEQAPVQAPEAARESTRPLPPEVGFHNTRSHCRSQGVHIGVTIVHMFMLP